MCCNHKLNISLEEWVCLMDILIFSGKGGKKNQILLSSLASLLTLSLVTEPALLFFFLTCVVLINCYVFSFTLLFSDIQELF